ncbi:GGDEF domain-containing protein [Novosphingobium colocasiae]|uniref:GGDEF domain-containing protein n=1 Tax=Novosphingobium colocasiae TaxID=1256513 RepID=UPI0035ADE8E7
MLHTIQNSTVVGPELSGASALPGFWHCDVATDTITWTEGVYEMFGYPRDARLDRREVVELYSDESRLTLERLRSHAIRTAQAFSLDAAIRCVNGVDRWLRITGVPLVKDGRVVSLQGTKQDVTAERAAWEAMRQIALRDAVTGLANRWAFQQSFLDLPTGSATLAEIEALVLFDMNRFKQINDGWGHQAGDACLAAFSRRLAERFADALLVARIGGDEFAVLLSRSAVLGSAAHRLSQALPHLFAPLGWNGRMLPVQAAVGIAMARENIPCDPAQLYALADADLYRAKARFRTRAEDHRIAG